MEVVQIPIEDLVLVKYDVPGKDNFIQKGYLDMVDIRGGISHKISDPRLWVEALEALFLPFGGRCHRKRLTSVGS